jgi:hypothetical protein
MPRSRRVPFIFSLLRNANFQEVRPLLEQWPDEASALNSARTTPLAVLIQMLTEGMVCTALSQNSPYFTTWVPDAVDALLQAYPRGVEHVNKRGDTALHVACRHGGSLLDDCGGNRNNSILRWAVDRMIDACPSVAAIQDACGKIPLRLVANLGGGPMDIIKKLARAYPAALVERGSPVVDMLDCDLYWDRAVTLVRLHPTAALAEGGSIGYLNPFQMLYFRIEFSFLDEIRPRTGMVPTRSFH